MERASIDAPTGGVGFINPDVLAKRISDHERTAAQSRRQSGIGRRIERWLHASVDAHQTVGVETVLATDKYCKLVERARAQGFRVRLIYVFLANANLNVARVRDRVAKGGHDVPEASTRPARAILRPALPGSSTSRRGDDLRQFRHLAVSGGQQDRRGHHRRWPPDPGASGRPVARRRRSRGTPAKPASAAQAPLSAARTPFAGRPAWLTAKLTKNSLGRGPSRVSTSGRRRRWPGLGGFAMERDWAEWIVPTMFWCFSRRSSWDRSISGPASAAASTRPSVAERQSQLRASLEQAIADAHTRIELLGAGLEQERVHTEAAQKRRWRKPRGSRWKKRAATSMKSRWLSATSSRALADIAVAERAHGIEPILQDSARQVIERFSG